MKNNVSLIMVVLFLCLHSLVMNAQLKFTIDSVEVFLNVNEDPNLLFTSSYGDGPGLSFYCSVINISDTIQYLSGSNNSLEIFFYVNDWTFREEAVPVLLPNEPKIELQPNEGVYFFVVSYPFLGTSLNGNSSKLEVYHNLLLAIPTIKIRFRDGFNFLETSVIRKVLIEQ